MEQIVKRPRGRPPTNKDITKPKKEIVKTTNKDSVNTTNKDIVNTMNKDIVKPKKDSIVKTPKEIKPKPYTETKDTTQKLRTSKPLDIPHIKEMQRADEKNEYKREMQTMLKERLRQGKLKVKLEQNMIELEAIMNGL
jgi:hypothetical protein